MELSNEDNLRLNVLLAQELHAVRIDESRMVVYGLSGQGEARIPLNPTGRDEGYLKLIRQLLSTHVLGSPGGYPVYLKRWTRMGQARDASLEKLLLLGEPEAVVAVVHAQGLTDELARRAWWANPAAENARRMLERECVAKGSMGPELADFLVEYLPFEEEHQAVIDTIRLVLQPGLIGKAQREQLWSRCKRKNTGYVGFLEAIPDNLPIKVPAHEHWHMVRSRAESLVEAHNPYAVQLCRSFSPSGQAFLEIAARVLGKPANQDVVVALLEVVGTYFQTLRIDDKRRRRIDLVISDAAAAVESKAPGLLGIALETLPAFSDQIRAMLILSMLSEQLVAPIFGRTNAIGTVMRKKIALVSSPIMEQFSLLRDVGK